MKVKELKELLNTYQDDEEIHIYDTDCGIVFNIDTIDKFEHLKEGLFIIMSDQNNKLQVDFESAYHEFYFPLK